MRGVRCVGRGVERGAKVVDGFGGIEHRWEVCERHFWGIKLGIAFCSAGFQCAGVTNGLRYLSEEERTCQTGTQHAGSTEEILTKAPLREHMHCAAKVEILLSHSLVECLVVYIHGTAMGKAANSNLNEPSDTEEKNNEYVRAKLDLSPTVRHGTRDDDGGDQAHLLVDSVDHRFEEDGRAIDVASIGGVNEES